MVSKHTTLYLRISEAKSLLSKDLNGKSDPYCVLKVDNEIISRTATVYKNLEPLWAEEYTLHMPYGFTDLSVSVYDEDRVSGDDIIGTVSITKDVIHKLSDPRGLENWFPLQKADKDWEIQGEILLEYGIRPSDSSSQNYIFYVTIEEGRDLAPKDRDGYCDPYVTVQCLDETRTTARQKKTRFPEWHERFEFALPDVYEYHEVVLTVYDKDRLRSDDFMGQVHLPLSKVPYNTTKKWHSVAHKPEKTDVKNPIVQERRGSKVDRGKIRLKIFLLEEIVLPLPAYQPIIDVLTDAAKPHKHKKFGSICWRLLNEVRQLDLNETAGALMRYYLSQDTAISFLDCITKLDIDDTESCHWAYVTLPGKLSLDCITKLDVDDTDDPHTLFRGNTLGTKAMDQFMKIVGMPYLYETLYSTIDKIFNERKTVELDPHRVNSVRRRHSLHKESENDFLQNSQDVLQHYMADVMEAIFNSVEQCPLKMRLVFRNLTHRVKEKWPETEHQDCPYQAVVGFLFLRFFAPAILSPKLFNLQDHHPNVKISRTLTLLAKLTQLIGNLTSFQVKEEWFQPLIPILKTYVVKIKDFINRLVEVAPPDAYTTGLKSPLSISEEESGVILRHGVLYKCRYHPKRLLRPFVFKKRHFWLTRKYLHYSKTTAADGNSKFLDVQTICAVEKLDYGALGKSNIGQIIVKSKDGEQDILYFQAKDVNEVTNWISSLRKTCQYNKCRVSSYHPGVYKHDKWTCCHKQQTTAPGCNQTYHGVIIGDWQDPLDTAREAQIITSQFYHGLYKLQEKERIYQGEVIKDNSVTNPVKHKLEVVEKIIQVVDTIQNTHSTELNGLDLEQF